MLDRTNDFTAFLQETNPNVNTQSECNLILEKFSKQTFKEDYTSKALQIYFKLHL